MKCGFIVIIVPTGALNIDKFWFGVRIEGSGPRKFGSAHALNL